MPDDKSGVILVSTAEPADIKQYFTPSPIPEQYGMDFIISSKMGMIGVQRKTIDDFLSSMRDGRFATQAIKSANLKHKYLMLEGEIHTTRDGYIITSWTNNITIIALQKMMLSVGLDGYQVIRTADAMGTITTVKIIEEWGRKERHSTMTGRPGVEKDPWGRKSADAQAVYFLQGLPGIGHGMAKRLYEHWGLPLVWSISMEDLISVPGIGKHKAKQLWEFVNGDIF